MPEPTFPEFVRLAQGAALVPVWREFLFDRETAVSAYAKLARVEDVRPPGHRAEPPPDATPFVEAFKQKFGAMAAQSDRRPRFGFLLESVVGGEKWARYTFLGTRPRSAWRLQPGGRISTWSPGGGWTAPVESADPFADLDRRLREARPATAPGLPRFFGGAVGYLAYDVARYIEHLPDAPPDDLGSPDAVLLFTDVVLAIDNVFGRAQAIATVDVADADGEAELRRRYDEAVAKLEAVERTLATEPPPAPLSLGRTDGEPTFTSTFDRAGFEAAVERAREYIAAGDAFQIVLSQRLTVPLRGRPFDLYRALRSLNPSPYLYFLELDDVTLVGSSPEVLVRVEDGRVTVRPIAGTRPRSGDEDTDRRRAKELLADPKELAEHLMLVDLGRNDVGRIADYGSVRVTDYMSIEQYSHVMHIVSQVEGDLRDGLSAIDAFRACFPAGTVSGAPKIRAMEIIDELEPVRRGSYAGAVCYFAYGGRAMDTAIAIRTLLIEDARAHVQAGAGIVADSVPATEYEETIAKAMALLRVLQVVGTG